LPIRPGSAACSASPAVSRRALPLRSSPQASSPPLRLVFKRRKGSSPSSMGRATPTMPPRERRRRSSAATGPSAPWRKKLSSRCTPPRACSAPSFCQSSCPPGTGSRPNWRRSCRVWAMRPYRPSGTGRLHIPCPACSRSIPMWTPSTGTGHEA
jgi:hypothetical protein